MAVACRPRPTCPRAPKTTLPPGPSSTRSSEPTPAQGLRHWSSTDLSPGPSPARGGGLILSCEPHRSPLPLGEGQGEGRTSRLGSARPGDPALTRLAVLAGLSQRERRHACSLPAGKWG